MHLGFDGDVAMGKWFNALIQFFPLSLFATYAFWHGTPTDARWLEAFQLGAVAALVQLVLVVPQRYPTNRLILAANLYLLLGGAAVLTQQWWVLRLYDALQEAGILMAIFAVGVVATYASSAGFVGVAEVPAALVRRASLWMLAAAALAVAASVIFQGDRTWAAIVPILGLAALHRILVYRIRQSREIQVHNYAMERPDEA